MIEVARPSGQRMNWLDRQRALAREEKQQQEAVAAINSEECEQFHQEEMAELEGKPCFCEEYGEGVIVLRRLGGDLLIGITVAGSEPFMVALASIHFVGYFDLTAAQPGYQKKVTFLIEDDEVSETDMARFIFKLLGEIK